MGISIGIGASLGGLVGGGTAWVMGYSTKVIVAATFGGAVIGAILGAYILPAYIATMPTSFGGLFTAGQSVLNGLVKWYSSKFWANSLGGIGIIALLGLLFPALEERGALNPSSDQLEKINAAIQFIEKQPGYKVLADAIKTRNFYVYPEQGYSVGYQPHTTTNIHLGEGLLDFDVEFLASTIIHEYVHSISLPVFKGTARGEIWAYEKQAEFLKTIGIYGYVNELNSVYKNTSYTYLSDLAYYQALYLTNDKRCILEDTKK